MSEPIKATLSKATSLLFHIAAKSHTLRDMFGIELNPDSEGFRYLSIERPWLEPHPVRKNEYTFSADTFARRLDACSTGEQHMMLFILNVWNPAYAKSKGWQFDLFRALDSLDPGNRDAIAWFLHHPIWP